MREKFNHLLVTGSHRSGTTWVGRTIALHQNVQYVHEPFNLHAPNREFDLKLDCWFEYAPASVREKVIKQAFEKKLYPGCIHNSLYLCKRQGLDRKKPIRLSFNLVRNMFYRQTVLIKDPIALLSAGWLHEMFNLKVICMIRNPLAFAGSLKKAGWFFDFNDLKRQKILMEKVLFPFKREVEEFSLRTVNIVDQACLLWNILHYVILSYKKKYSTWLFVKYEDIAKDPVAGFKCIFDYLALDLNVDVLSGIEKFTSTGNPVEAKSAAFQARDSKKSLDTWKSRLTVNEINRVKTATERIAVAFYGEGYLDRLTR